MKRKALKLNSVVNSISADLILSNIEKFSRFGLNETGGVTRQAFSEEDRLAREELIRMMKSELKLKIKIDGLGNIWGRREGLKSYSPAIITGSHLDSVIDGGKFDGPAGVFCAFEVFRSMNVNGLDTIHPLELVIFASEEPNTFGISTVGSRGVAGLLKKYEIEALKDERGRDLKSAIASVGGNLELIEKAINKKNEIKYFVELHIEQTPNLYNNDKAIGVVTGSTGIQRNTITVNGKSGHSGTTIMEIRKDALCAAARIITGIEEAAHKCDGKAVATVGRLSISPNALNIIANNVKMDVEIRSYDPEMISRINHQIDRVIESLRQKYDIKIEQETKYVVPPSKFSDEVVNVIRQAADDLNFDRMDLISMAGHDAVHMNNITKVGMIFIPSKGGISHCSEEWTEKDDLFKGAQCLLKTLLYLDKINR